MTRVQERVPGGRLTWAKDRRRLPLLLVAVVLATSLFVLLAAQTTGAWDGNGSAEAAWAELQVGLRAWRAPDGHRQQSYTDRGWCGKFVAHAYGAEKVGFRDARAMQTAAVKRGTMRYTPATAAPLGALVFYDLSEHGHVGIHVGGGYVVHAGFAERVRLDYWDTLDGYVGWSYPPPRRWPGRSSVSARE
jgi:hypothetical protein